MLEVKIKIVDHSWASQTSSTRDANFSGIRDVLEFID